MRILVLVLSSHTWPYPALVRTIKRTWASVHVPEIETLFYFGGRPLRLKGRDLDLPVPDDLAHVGQKTLACFDYVLANRDFDLVFRTNCSSYVDLPNLRDFARRYARDSGFYAGSVQTHGETQFASGSGYFLTRDLVELAARKRFEWDHAQLDDVALADVLHRSGVQVVPAPRIDYANSDEVKHVDTSQFHFRCKTDTRFRIDDRGIMLELHRTFSRFRGAPVRSPSLLMLGLARRASAIARRARSTALAVVRRS